MHRRGPSNLLRQSEQRVPTNRLVEAQLQLTEPCAPLLPAARRYHVVFTIIPPGQDREWVATWDPSLTRIGDSIGV
jgi:hypothetical protein